MVKADGEPDEVALLALLPADGAPADGDDIRSELGWDAGRYARARDRLQGRGYILAGHGPGAAVCRDLRAVPEEFRPACGHPGSHAGLAPWRSAVRALC